MKIILITILILLIPYQGFPQNTSNPKGDFYIEMDGVSMPISKAMEEKR